MADIVRCPYCVSGLEFHPMVAHVDGRYICCKCGHTARPAMQVMSATVLNAYRWQFEV